MDLQVQKQAYIILCKDIMMKIMTKLHSRYAKRTTWDRKVTPTTKTRLDNQMKQTKGLTTKPANAIRFQVINGGTKYSISLNKKSCSCVEWAITGIPYKYVAICMRHIRGNLEDFCDGYYTIDMYPKTHNSQVVPLLETNLDPGNNDEIVQPLVIK